MVGGVGFVTSLLFVDFSSLMSLKWKKDIKILTTSICILLLEFKGYEKL